MLMSELSVTPVPANHADLQPLIAALDAYLLTHYPPDGVHTLTAEEQAGGGDVWMCLLYLDDCAVACGGVRFLGDGEAEIKRMWVDPDYRGRGLAKCILSALEKEAASRGVKNLLLETGDAQPEALALYRNAGYVAIPPFGEYIASPLSRCFGKPL